MNVVDLKKYKDNCYSALSRDITEFEKNFLFIAGGILAFSITFIKDIVSIPQVIWFMLLLLSWLLIILSIACMMYAFLQSAKASDKLWEAVDQFQLQNNLYKDETSLSVDQWKQIKAEINCIFYPSKKQLKSLRTWAVNLFLAGIVFLSAFVAINLSSERVKHQDKKENKTSAPIVKP